MHVVAALPHKLRGSQRWATTGGASNDSPWHRGLIWGSWRSTHCKAPLITFACGVPATPSQHRSRFPAGEMHKEKNNVIGASTKPIPSRLSSANLSARSHREKALTFSRRVAVHSVIWQYSVWRYARPSHSLLCQSGSNGLVAPLFSDFKQLVEILFYSDVITSLCSTYIFIARKVIPPPTCSPLSPSVTHSLFHSRLKTHLFHKCFPP